MGSKALGQCHIVASGQFKGSWTRDKVKGWIVSHGGKYQDTVDSDTTHLVITEGGWKTRGQLVQTAIEANNGGHNIKIVSFDWLEDCLMHNSKKREGPYLWTKPSGPSKDARSKAPSSLMTEVFEESTARYLDDDDVKRLEKDRALQQRAEQKQHEIERKIQKRERLSIKEQSVLFKHGAKKAKDEIFSDNYHIYMDRYGFHYDIILTNVDVSKNTNQRLCLTLQIFESNIEPPSYAMNANLCRSNQQETNDLLVANGSNFDTAFRKFREVFLEKTGEEWQDLSQGPANLRSSHHNRAACSNSSSTRWRYHLPFRSVRVQSQTPYDESNIVPQETIQGIAPINVGVDTHGEKMNEDNGPIRETPPVFRVSTEAQISIESVAPSDMQAPVPFTAPTVTEDHPFAAAPSQPPIAIADQSLKRTDRKETDSSFSSVLGKRQTTLIDDVAIVKVRRLMPE